MGNIQKNNTKTFYEAFRELQNIAENMKNDPEKSIDDMEPNLKRAIELHKICKERTILRKYQNELQKENEETGNHEDMSDEENFDGDEPPF